MKNIDQFLDSVENKKLLVVFPHPDDESVMAGGLIQRAMKLGFAVTVLTLTEGNRGKIHINGKGRSVSEIRRAEMALAMSRLNVSDWIMWRFEDGRLKKRAVWKKRLVDFLRETKPGVVVSYDLSGVSGHPDHISLAREIIKYVKLEGKIDLLWPSFEGSIKDKVVESRVVSYLVKSELELNLNFGEAVKKWRAAFSHASQGLQGFVGKPWWVLAFVARKEWYSRYDPNIKYKFKFVGFKI